MDLPDDEPQTVDAMLSYLYKRNYNDQCAAIDGVAVAPMAVYVRVFTIADKNFIPELKERAASNFVSRVQDEWSDPAFAESISEIYLNGPAEDRTLRDIALYIVKGHAQELYENEQTYKPFHAVLGDISEFAADVSKVLAFGFTNKKVKEKELTTYD